MAFTPGNLTNWIAAIPEEGTVTQNSKAAVTLDYDFRKAAPQGVYNADVLVTTSGSPAAQVRFVIMSIRLFSYNRMHVKWTAHVSG